jgi:pentatricopeptide repeat protein
MCPLPVQPFGVTGVPTHLCGAASHQVSAHSFAGDWRAALEVRRRMAAAGAPPSVHVYNALIAAAERAGQFDAGLALHAAMAADGVAPDCTTRCGLQRCAAPAEALLSAACTGVVCLWIRSEVYPHLCSACIVPRPVIALT